MLVLEERRKPKDNEKTLKGGKITNKKLDPRVSGTPKDDLEAS